MNFWTNDKFVSFSTVKRSAGSAHVCSNVPEPTDTGCGTYDGTTSCCTQQNPCNKGEGDCDQDHDCKEHLGNKKEQNLKILTNAMERLCGCKMVLNFLHFIHHCSLWRKQLLF